MMFGFMWMLWLIFYVMVYSMWKSRAWLPMPGEKSDWFAIYLASSVAWMFFSIFFCSLRESPDFSRIFIACFSLWWSARLVFVLDLGLGGS